MEMMKMKKTGCLLLFLLGSTGLTAQETTPVLLNDFWANTYVDGGIGIQTLFTPDAHHLAFSKRITPAFHLGAGKWFSPFWGIHVGMNTYSYNGYRSGWMEGEPFHPLGNVDVDMDGSFRYYLRYLNVNADIRVSLLGLIRQRDLTSQMHDLQAYAGVGYAHFFRYRGTTKANAFTGHLGLRYRVRVHERVDVNLDGTVGLLPSHMHPTRHPYASTLAFSVGCTYHIGQRIFRRAIERIPVETVRYRTDTVLVREVPVPGEERIIERIVAPRSENTAMAVIRFPLNSAKPYAEQDIQLYEVGRFLQANPEAIVLIEGYADAETGAEKYNKRLSFRRAKAVGQMLTDTYGIRESQLRIQAHGSTEQPYKEQAEWNRVAIVRLLK